MSESDRIIIDRNGQRQVGELVSSLGGGGGGTTTLNINTGAIPVGSVVTVDASGVALADSATITSNGVVVGMIVSQNTVVTDGVISDVLSGLTKGATYWLSNFGTLTTTPATDETLVKIGIATSATELVLRPEFSPLIPAADANVLTINTGNLSAGKLVVVTAGSIAALADTSTTVSILGMVSAQDEVVTNGKVSGLTGLTAGSQYFLTTNGDMSTTPPTGTGNTVFTVGVALSTTTFNLQTKEVVTL